MQSTGGAAAGGRPVETGGAVGVPDGGPNGTGGSPNDGGASTLRVRVSSGWLEGTLEGDTRVFRGIPYAAPPTGERRFAPPAPAQAWSGVLPAMAFGPSCPQPNDPVAIPGPQNEDCLTLNVAAPVSSSRALPVVVFLHGGGFKQGGSADFSLRGLGEAGGLVVVTVNYRLGALGFLVHPALDAALSVPSGNMGLRDQQRALEWVRDNIAAFGGDPSSVTLSGQSAGSVATCLHLVARGSEALAHRFILESGSCVNGPHAPIPRESAVAQGKQLATALCGDRPDTLACLRGLPARALSDWATPESLSYIDTVALLFGTTKDKVPNTRFGWWPDVDGALIPDQPAALIERDAFRRLPVLLGTNLRETDIGGSYGFPKLSNRLELSFWVNLTQPAVATRLLEHYMPDTDAGANEAWIRIGTDREYRCPTRALARALRARGAPSYLYSFEHLPALHTSELDYVFGPTGGASLPRISPPLLPASPVVSSVQAYWSAFARSGDPAAPALPVWPPYTLEEDRHLVLSDPPHAAAHLSGADCDFVDGLPRP